MKSNTMNASMHYKPLNMGRWIVWTLYALILIFAPMVFNKGASLSILSQMGTMIIVCLSYNILLGQGGMLSFGHAVYSGLGAFMAIHAMNMATNGAIWMPVSLIPLVGGVAGIFFGILFGYVTTKKAGTTFSMITLGIVEMVFACSLMFPEFFGGEGGISTNRVIGDSFLGISYGPQIQVYYLIAFWLFVSTVGMFAYTQTPLGRMSNAVRDNPERVEFIGYNTRWVRFMTVIVSAFFAGIAGGLSAINYEIVTAENVSAMRSGTFLLFTFIGGVGFFFGPMIGAVVGVILTVILHEFTKASHFYIGAIFILIVMYAPGGIASLIMMNLRLAKFGKFKRIWPTLWRVSAATLVALVGFAIAIEMLYHVTLNATDGPMMELMRFKIDTSTPHPWIVSGVIIAIGSYLFYLAKDAFQQKWGEVNTEIEDMIRKAEA